MAITDTQKVDYLFKKVGYNVAKTDVSTVKSPSNESIASPLVVRGDTIWQQSSLIPVPQPASSTGVVLAYNDALFNSVQCTVDTTSTTSRTWKTGLTNWVTPDFDATYQVKVYLDTTGSTTPQSTGTRIYPDGSGNNDEWFFDYSAGILNFIGTNLPSLTFTGKSIFIVGSRYVGQLGLSSFPSGVTLGNISIVDKTISVSSTNGNLTLSANGTGSVNTGKVYASSVTVTGAISSQSTAASTSYTTGALTVAGGVGIGGNLNVQGNTTIGGNLTVLGNVVSFSANTVNVADSLLYLATTNTSSDLVDIGLVGHYNDGVTSGHTGIVRDSTTKEWYIFQGYVAEPDNNNIDISTASLSTLNISGLKLGNLVVSNNAISVTNGGFTISSVGTVTLNTTSALGLPSGTTAQRPAPAALVAGQIRFNNDSNVAEYWNGAQWIPIAGSLESQLLYPDGTSNTYSLTYGVTAAGLMISINGTVQQPGIAYTTNTANKTITFVETPLVTDVIDIRFLSPGYLTPDYNNFVVDVASLAVGTSAVTIDTFPATTYRSAKYIVTVSNATEHYMAEIMLIHNGTTAKINTFGVLYTGALSIVDFSCNIVSGQVVLQATGVSSSNQLRLQKTYFVI